MAEKKSFVLYLDYKQHLELLSDTERGQLLMALFSYAENGEIPSLSGMPLMAFSFIRAQLDRDAERWSEIQTVRAAAGQQGGMASANKRRQAQAIDAASKQNKASEAFTKNTEQTPANQAVNATKNVDENVDENVITLPPPTSQAQGARFEEFWGAYPKRVGKEAARKAWHKIKPNAKLHARILSAVEKAKRSSQWARDSGQYIPHPATWLNQGRWDDELEVTDGGTSGQHSGQAAQKPPALIGFGKPIDI